MGSIHYGAVGLAALAAFILGGIWYSPRLFGKAWMKEAKPPQKKKHGTEVYVISFMFALIAAVAFAVVTRDALDVIQSVQMGLVIGICWVFSSFGINYHFAGRSTRMLLIDGGYHIVQFLLYGILIGLWR